MRTHAGKKVFKINVVSFELYSVINGSLKKHVFVFMCEALLLLSYIIVLYIQLSLLKPCSGQWPNFEEAIQINVT